MAHKETCGPSCLRRMLSFFESMLTWLPGVPPWQRYSQSWENMPGPKWMLPIGLLFRPPQLQVKEAVLWPLCNSWTILLSFQLAQHSHFICRVMVALRYMNASSEGSIYASDENIDFLEGIGKSGKFGSTFCPCIWNGWVIYMVILDWMPLRTPIESPSDSPSGEPSIEPSQDPSGQPSMTPSVDAPSNELSQDPSTKLSKCEAIQQAFSWTKQCSIHASIEWAVICSQ